MLTLCLRSQTSPPAVELPYLEDFASLSTFPTGWRGWAVCSSGTSMFITCDASYFRQSPAVANLSGVAPATAASVNQANMIKNYNGKIGFENSSNWLSSLVFAINTENTSNIRFCFDFMTIKNPYGTPPGNDKVEVVQLQYRVGTTGNFTPIPSFYYYNNQTTQVTGTNPQNLQNFCIDLPAVCNNKSDVQFRWLIKDSIGNGERPTFAIDNVLVHGDCASVFFSEYLEAGGNNQYLELYTTNFYEDYQFGGDTVLIYHDGSATPTAKIPLVGSIPKQGTFLLANSLATIYPNTPDQTSPLLNFDGNDAIALKQGSNITDIIGDIGVNPGLSFSNYTKNATLQRIKNNQKGQFNPSVNFSSVLNQWEKKPSGTVSNLDSFIAHHCCTRLINYHNTLNTEYIIYRCIDSNYWHYYGTRNELYVAVDKKNNIAPMDWWYWSVTLETVPTTRLDYSVPNYEHGSVLMQRYWNNEYATDYVTPVDFRMFFPMADTLFVENTRDFEYNLLKLTNPNSLAQKGEKLEWFKSIDMPYSAAFIATIIGNKFPLNNLKMPFVHELYENKTCVTLKGIPSFYDNVSFVGSGGTAGMSFAPPNQSGIVKLPLKWGDLKAKRLDEYQHELYFETFGEEFTAYFEVEFSSDLDNFASIRNPIPPQFHGKSRYKFPLDNRASDGYYRIKAKDKDSLEFYSPIFSLSDDISIHEKALSIWPNPIDLAQTSKLKIEGIKANETYDVVIYDMKGKSLYELNQNRGDTISIMTKLPANIYILQLVIKDKKYSFKLEIR